jgi:outer membrane lipoprotein carrier protein
MRFLRSIFARTQVLTGSVAMGVLLGCGWARGEALQDLALFLKTTPKVSTHFVQTVTSPKKPGADKDAAPKVKISKGSFEFIRPDRFRFDYTHPYAQSIVADGQTLWIYDVDLAQITSKSESEALANTPASLIARSSDISDLSKGFVLESQSGSDGLEWVKATPRMADGPIQFIRLGLKVTQNAVQLSRLEMLDAFNQSSVLTFDDFQINPSTLSPQRFVFKPPVGVEVIKQ